MFRRLCQVLIFVLLTLLTQIGGVAYLACLAVTSLMRIQRAAGKFLVFILVYLAATASANVMAPTFGRVPISCFAQKSDTLAVRSPIYCLLNRNYVTPPLHNLVSSLADHVDKKFPGTTTLALDANFPFWDGFPLIPHFSQDDGRKLDIAFYYKDSSGAFRDRATRSPIGYFAFEQPAPSDSQPCEGTRQVLTSRWNLDWLQPFFSDYQIEERRTAYAMQRLSTKGVQEFSVEKVFIEPHLKERLGVASSIIRFQGCRAARHDDHIHIQIK